MTGVTGALTAALLAALQQPTGGRLEGVVRDSASQAAVAGATVRIERIALSRKSDTDGRFVLDSVPPGEWRVEISARGFHARAVEVLVPATGSIRLAIDLARQPLPLPSIEVSERQRSLNEGVRARELFDGSVETAVSMLSRREIRAMPTLVEPDVFRALQAQPGIAPLNDFNSQLYVRGGAPDQNAVFLDGVRVWGPHHLFGMNGVFNVDAVEDVRFHRGGHSTRYGGGLSSVIDVTQREGERGFGIEGGLSLTGARAATGGVSDSGNARWMVAARKSYLDAAIGSTMPYAFGDAQARITLGRTATQQLTASAFVSDDRFDLGFDTYNRILQSRWDNRLGALAWDWRPGRWTARLSGWGSSYRAVMYNGKNPDNTRTQSNVGAGGIRAQLERTNGKDTTLRVGLELERTSVSLAGGDATGSYFQGTASSTLWRPAASLEWERRLGALRLAPAARVSRFASGATLAEPKLAVRWQMNEATSLTAAISRSFQDVSALHDSRSLLPGPTFWFVHPDRAPASRSDMASLELNAWRGTTWQLTAGVFTREMRDAPRWLPVGERDLASVSFDDGHARGLEVALRRYGGSVSGWLAYSLGNSRFTDAATGVPYDAVWDRRHTFNGAALWSLGRLSLSAQAQYASGHPFWPFLGDVLTPQFSPFEGLIESIRQVPVWGADQIRHPAYARLDLGARFKFRPRGKLLEPYVNLQNVGGRGNVLFYEPARETVTTPITTEERTTHLRARGMPPVLIPTIGLNVRF